jgi:nicotinamide mononucleotide (NMN) deamidase PncC
VDKPVGTVVMAIDLPSGRHAVQTRQFAGDRRLIRQLAAQAVLDLVRRTLMIE